MQQRYEKQVEKTREIQQRGDELEKKIEELYML